MNMQLLLAAAASELESMRKKEEEMNEEHQLVEGSAYAHGLHQSQTRFPTACMNLLYSIPGRSYRINLHNSISYFTTKLAYFD